MTKSTSKRRPGQSIFNERQRMATEKVIIAAMRDAGPMSMRDSIVSRRRWSRNRATARWMKS